MSRSSIDTLPREVRTWLANRLVERGFRGYDELVNELQKQGFKRSRCAIWRWGRKLESDIRAEQIKRLL